MGETKVSYNTDNIPAPPLSLKADAPWAGFLLPPTPQVEDGK